MKNFNKLALNVLDKEIEGLKLLRAAMPKDFEDAASALSKMTGRLIISGIGKSGYIGQKLASSFASTGTRSFYIHPAEASHGDLGMIDESDIVMLLSNSGETKELLDIISYCKRFFIPIIAMTMRENSVLAASATYLLNIPIAEEASSVNAPTTSSTMMLALGDALLVSVHEHKGFSKDDFALFHPGGKLGASMLTVAALMHTEESVPKISLNTKMSDTIIEMTSKRFGCAAVIDENGKICGIITDGDLRAKMNKNLLDDTAGHCMTHAPITITQNTFAAEALGIMSKKQITSILVAEDSKLIGIIHIHDLLRAGVK